MNQQPVPQQDPFAAIPAVPQVAQTTSEPPMQHVAVQPVAPAPIVHPVKPQQPVAAAVHEIDLFAPPTTLSTNASTTTTPATSNPLAPQPVQPSSPEYWPQPALSPEDHESLFGRERLTRAHKIVIVVIAVVVLGVIIGGGAWLYYTAILNQPTTSPITNTTNIPTVNTPTVNTATLDTDNDGLTDDAERRLGTNPRNDDTDADSYLDGEEVEHGFSPLE